ncbi:MAG: nitrogen fixation protein NifX [Magnetococcales bacterium]|nr:nitrogen fixation protein NifX [Magnetococcales bacterium]
MIIQRNFQVVPNTGQLSDPMEKQSLLAAFASSDMKQVNEHFGTASRFVIYRISSTQKTLEQVCEFDSAKQDGNEDKLGPRLQALSGCHSIHCLAVGASAVRLLLKRGIYPAQVEDATPIQNILNNIQNELIEGTPPYPTNRLAGRKNQAEADSFKQTLLEDIWLE